MIDVEKIIKQANKEIERLKDVEVFLKFPLIRALTLIAVVQMALRRPDLPPETRDVARKFVDELIALIGRASPVLADFARLGDDPEYDQPKK